MTTSIEPPGGLRRHDDGDGPVVCSPVAELAVSVGTPAERDASACDSTTVCAQMSRDHRGEYVPAGHRAGRRAIGRGAVPEPAGAVEAPAYGATSGREAAGMNRSSAHRRQG